MNVYSSERKSLSTSWWRESNAINLPTGWLADPSGYGNLSSFKCWSLLLAWWGLSCGGGKVSLGGGKSLWLSLHPCMISVLLLSALNKRQENWGKKQISLLQTEISSTWLLIISSTVCSLVTVTWNPITVDSESFIYITQISLSPISNLFPLISLKI